MRNYNQKQIMQEVVSELICNRCGRRYVFTTDTFDNVVNQNQFQTIILRFGYGSRFDSATAKEFELCDDCIEELNKSFKHPIDL